MITAGLTFAACSEKSGDVNFQFSVEKFDNIQILRYPVLGWENLPLKQKEFIYYLSQAALQGRDILFDQNYQHNLTVRRTLEAIYNNYEGDRLDKNFLALETYLKKVWFHNGIHDNNSADKFYPEMKEDEFDAILKTIPTELLPINEDEDRDIFNLRITTIIFNNVFNTKRITQDEGEDLIETSACNYYSEGITQSEVETFYDNMKVPNDSTPISYGLNSQLVKIDGQLIEKTYKIGGMYTEALEKIVFWLEKALPLADTEHQKQTLALLIDYYKSGDLKTFDEFNISWVNDLDSHTDFVNGFTETYGDPLGIKASWESIVNFKNDAATGRTQIIGDNAQWFEDNSPINDEFKKKEVKGVSAKVITVAILAGDCYPSTPIGINLPNADWIRKDHGSKSVTIENITYAYDQAAAGSGLLDEFAYTKDEISRAKKYGFLTHNLMVDMHECLGHGSGQLMDGVKGDELKAYGATIEEARADLFSIYYLADPKMVELGLLPDAEAYKAEYDNYILNGMMLQLNRIQPGKNIEQTHMRNRQLIASWVYEKGAANNVIEKKIKDDKTYFIINNHQEMRVLLGQLLKEIQRIKSTGDYQAAKDLVEKYAVKIDKDLHQEVLARYNALNLSSHKGFINPKYIPVIENGKIVDIKLDYSEGYTEQMLRYSNENSHLPNYN